MTAEWPNDDSATEEATLKQTKNGERTTIKTNKQINGQRKKNRQTSQ